MDTTVNMADFQKRLPHSIRFSDPSPSERRNLYGRNQLSTLQAQTAGYGSGEDYRNLKEVVVILITPYDPFGLNRMVYTVQNRCVEEPDMPYDDGAKTIYLYTRGKEGNPPEELQQFLTYMEHTTWENAVNSTLQEIQRMVDTAKTDKGVSLEYMKSFERDRRLQEQAWAEGMAEGRREGLAEGREEERARTEAEHARAEKAEEELRKLKERFGIE